MNGRLCVVVLSDNRKVLLEMETEHGLSVYVETDKHRLLLDTGGSDLFLRNAGKLGIDLSTVDYVFVSHGHSDHIGGLPYFLKINSKAKIILSSEILQTRYFSKRKALHEISLDFDFSLLKDRMILVENDFHLDEIHVFKNSSVRFKRPLANQTLFSKTVSGEMVSDAFGHELICAIGESRLFVFTGCAHHGLLNILETVRDKMLLPIDWVLGGFHLLDSRDGACYESELEIREIALKLRELYPETNFITGHCTGESAFKEMKDTIGNRLMYLFSGFRLND